VPTHDEFVAARDRAEAVLLRLPNVTSVGIGGRVRAGRRIPELVLKVYVDVKVPADQLAPSERMPDEIEGLPTDVVQMPTVGTSAVATPAPPGQPAIPFAKRDTEKHRPLADGSHMQGGLADNDYMGTLGCIMVSTTDATKAYAFTNWHVMQGQNHRDPTIGDTKAGHSFNKGQHHQVLLPHHRHPGRRGLQHHHRRGTDRAQAGYRVEGRRTRHRAAD